MKTKIITAIFAALTGSGAFAGVPIPANYLMDCWDGTFAYNKLNVQAEGDTLKFLSSGSNLSVYENLVQLPKDHGWGAMNVTFSLPPNTCLTANSDSKILTCSAEHLTVDVKGEGTGFQIDEKIDLKHVTVQIRKINELSPITKWGGETSGYELVVLVNNPLGTLALAQKYYHGGGIDQTHRCELK